MKKVNFRNIASTIFDMLGVLFWMLGLCATSESDSMAFALVNLGLLTIGSIFIILSLKINPERAKKFLYDPEEDKPHIEEHNYSPDFEALYKQIILRRVDELIQPGEVSE
jgi:hypothetical protein